MFSLWIYVRSSDSFVSNALHPLAVALGFQILWLAFIVRVYSGVGELFANISSILAAMMKSFSDNPPMLCVVSVIRT
jgi:hypothetical protein